MNTSYGERKARVETVDGKFVIKKKEEILPTDRIISYISNDYVQPIKIKLVDLNIIFGFLLGAVARVAFYDHIEKNKLFILSYGKMKSSVKPFTTVYKAVFKYIMKYAVSLNVSAISYNSFSTYEIDMKPTKSLTDMFVRMLTRVFYDYAPIERVRIGINSIADTIITKTTYKKIKDITQKTLEQDILGNNTIIDLLETYEYTKSSEEQ